MSRGKKSAGILLFRHKHTDLEVFLVHPGGPFWIKKDDGAWTLPKGEFDTELPLEAALRELREETGIVAQGNFIELKPIQQKGGKWVHAFAIEFDCDASTIRSNTFTMEWPPKSGRMQTFPEVDRAGWFTIDDARRKILASQSPLLDDLISRV